MGTTRIQLPGAMSKIRMLRALRIFRIFNRIQQMQRLIHVLVGAIPGVLCASSIFFATSSMYAVLAVDLFRDLPAGCQDDPDPEQLLAITARGRCFGVDYYGTYFRAWYTLFQIVTGDSWSEACVRPVLLYYQDDFLISTGVSF